MEKYQEQFVKQLATIAGCENPDSMVEFIKIMRQPGVMRTVEVDVHRYSSLREIVDRHEDAEVIKNMAFRKVRVKDAQWNINGETIHLSDDMVIEYIQRNESLPSTFHMEPTQVGEHLLGLRLNINEGTLLCKHNVSTTCIYPAVITLEFIGVETK